MTSFFRCQKCIMPNTKPDLFFDRKGVCDACRSAEQKSKIDWVAREKQLEEILTRFRSKDGRNYDCIIPVSGGKDSHFQTYIIKHVYKLNPLLVSFEPTYPTELGKKNLNNIRNFGVDLIQIQKNPIVYKKLGKKAFYRIGDHEWPNHVGIFTVPVQIAVRFNIPLIVWGENSQVEYGGPSHAKRSWVLDRRWLEEFGGLLGNRVEDMADEEVSMNDLKLYEYPDEKDLKRVGATGIFLGYFMNWDARAQVEIMKKYGFSIHEKGPIEGTYTNYENLDCALVAIHDYLKFVKYGFGRACDHACLDIRHGRITREEGLQLVKRYDGKIPWKALSLFLEHFEMSKKEFFSVCDSFTNKVLFATGKDGRFIHDKQNNLILKEFPTYDHDNRLRNGEPAIGSQGI